MAVAVEAPTAGRYLLYLDFQVEGQVRTAAFTVEATGAPATPDDAPAGAPADAPAADAPAAHAALGRAREARGAGPSRTARAGGVPTNECESVRQELQRHSLCVDWRVEGTHGVAGAASATSTYRVPDANVSAHLAPLLRRAESDSVSVPYARKIRVVFSLLQEDASVGRALHGWDLTHALHNISAYEALAPLARTVRALERVYDIQLESQVPVSYRDMSLPPTTEV